MEQVLEFFKTNFYAHFAAVGFAVGLVTRILMPGPDPMGFFATTGLGMAGSVLSVYVIKTYHLQIPISEPWSTYVAAIVGASAILTIIKIIRNIG